MATEVIRLDSCSSTPLANYLKALGILRLVSSPSNNTSGRAADAQVRGWWEHGRLHLATHLRIDALIRFLLNDYAPSAIIAPWNGGSGFYPADNKEGIGPFSSQPVVPRFQSIATGIAVATGEIQRRGWTVRPKDAEKASLIMALRGRLPDSALPWLDAAVALSGARLSFPQLLGSGGNDGRLDFTNTFMRRLVAARGGLFDAVTGAPAPDAERLLRAALVDEPVQGLSSYPTGQFAPGAAGGANATSGGYDGAPHSNPWDFVLALEGAILFAGGATRRHQGATESGASFPFTVRTTPAGWGGLVDADRDNVRAEFWAPLWSRPTGCDELGGLLKEGRATLGGKMARDGLDFARAAATLGTSRGVTAFQRYGFAKRQGNMYLATPLGIRRTASQAPETAELINDLDAGGWLSNVRRLAQDKKAPARARQIMKRFQDGLFALADLHTTPVIVQNALETLGEVVDWLSTSADVMAASRPPPLLRPAWLRHGDDGSAEFRVAAALASLGMPPALRPSAAADAAKSDTLPTVPVPMAAYRAPVDPATVGRRFREWDVGGEHAGAVWGARSLVASLVAMLERSSDTSTVDLLLVAAAPAGQDVITRFLAPDFNDRRCARLLGGLVWARPTPLPRPEGVEIGTPPFAYTALKLLFAPSPVVCAIAHSMDDDHVRRIPVPPGLVAGLRRGDVDSAVRSALGRALASGIASPFARRGTATTTVFGAGVDGPRLAATLLIPIRDNQLRTLLDRAYPTREDEDVA